MSIDRTKYMDESEVKQLRKVILAWNDADLYKGRLQGTLTWLVVDVALQTGLRVGEMAELKVKDIDYNRKAITIVRLKRKKPVPETLGIGDKLTAHLKAYLDGRTDGWLFMGKRGRLHREGLQRIWTNAVKRAGLPKELSIHSARHTMAVHLLKKTKNLRHVQKQLGHSSPTVTAGFYADVSFEDMQDGVNNLYPD